MTNDITTKDHLWKPGTSGNPKGRPKKKQALTELLRLAGNEEITIGENVMTAKDVLAKAVWRLLTTGELSLAGKRLEVQSVTEWANVVKWLYTHVDSPNGGDDEDRELIVRVVRVDKGEEYDSGIDEDEGREEIGSEA